MSKHKTPHNRKRSANRQPLTVAYIASKQNQDADMVDHQAWSRSVGLSYWRAAGYAQGMVVDCTRDVAKRPQRPSGRNGRSRTVGEMPMA
jgi:hypothetical protein